MSGKVTLRVCAYVSLLCTSIFVNQAQADEPDFRQIMTLRINGQLVKGAVESSIQLEKDPANEEAILNQNVFTLVRNSSAQLDVKIRSEDQVVDYTGSTQLKYFGTDCLAVSSAGFLTVNPSGTCGGFDLAMLQIFFFDPNGKAITYNYYLFSIK